MGFLDKQQPVEFQDEHPDKRRCSEFVWHPSGNWGHHVQCQKNATVQEEDGSWYCGTHSKAGKEKIRQRSNDRYKEQIAEHHRQNAIAQKRDEIVQATTEWLHTSLEQDPWMAAAAKVLRLTEELEKLRGTTRR